MRLSSYVLTSVAYWRTAMPKPRVDLDRLSIPKATASAAVPFVKAPDREMTPPGGPKSLTVKLTSEDYWALRDFCTQRERTTGKRLTHQEAMVLALHCLLRQESVTDNGHLRK